MCALDGGVDRRRERGSFGVEFGTSNCNQWGLRGVVILCREEWRRGSSQTNLWKTCFRYGAVDRRRQLQSVLESSGRTLLERGTILVVDVQPACPRGPGSGEADPASLSAYRATRLGYDPGGCAYYVPADALRAYGDPTDEPWFYPAALTPLQASHTLSVCSFRQFSSHFRPQYDRRLRSSSERLLAVVIQLPVLLPLLHYAFSALTLLVGRQEGLPAYIKVEWWDAGMVICLGRGADLHMAQLIPLPLS